MKKFILKTIIFMSLLLVFHVGTLFLPPTPRSKTSLLFAEIKKDSLFANVPSPRIIFIGDSNLSFGLNSQMIKDELNLNPVNTTIHAGLGLKYILDNAMQFIKEGDIIVLVTAYPSFFYDGLLYNGGSTLLRMVLDVDRSKIRLLNFEQMVSCFKESGNLALSKFEMKEYINVESSDVYGVNSFNQYGDANGHWNMSKENFEKFEISSAYDNRAIRKIKEFENEIHKKNAVLYISFPAYQDSSFDNSKEAIKKVHEEYIKSGFKILGTPDRYRMNDSMMFDTPYHLNKKGVDYRTKLLIEDLLYSFHVKNALPENF